MINCHQTNCTEAVHFTEVVLSDSGESLWEEVSSEEEGEEGGGAEEKLATTVVAPVDSQSTTYTGEGSV